MAEHEKLVRKKEEAEKDLALRVEKQQPEHGFYSFHWVPPDDFGPFEIIPGQTGQTSPELGAVYEILLSHDHQKTARRFVYPITGFDDAVRGIPGGAVIDLPTDTTNSTLTTPNSNTRKDN